MTHFSATRLAVIALVVALSLSALPIATANDTDDGPELEIDGNLPTTNETATQEIDSNLDLVTWEYDDDREGFVLQFRADSSTQITITEAVQFSEGSGQGNIYSTRLPADTSEIFVPVPRRGGQAAVTMVTPESLDNNRFSYVSTGEQEPDRPALNYERVQLMVIFTAAMASGATLGLVAWRREDEERTYERIL